MQETYSNLETLVIFFSLTASPSTGRGRQIRKYHFNQTSGFDKLVIRIGIIEQKMLKLQVMAVCDTGWEWE